MSRGGFDIKVTEQDFLGHEDRRWLGTRLNEQWMPRSITLDVSAFSAYHVTEFNGGIPSGIALGKITATGLYGPYDDAAVDGRETAAGLLFNTTKVGDGTGADLATAGDVGVALFWAGVVKTAFLPTFSGGNAGELDANGRADLAGFIRFE